MKKATSHPVFCVEVIVASEGKHGAILIASIPGREGTFTRAWGRPERSLTESELSDLSTTVSRWVIDAMILSHGHQGQLPFE